MKLATMEQVGNKAVMAASLGKHLVGLTPDKLLNLLDTFGNLVSTDDEITKMFEELICFEQAKRPDDSFPNASYAIVKA